MRQVHAFLGEKKRLGERETERHSDREIDPVVYA